MTSATSKPSAASSRVWQRMLSGRRLDLLDPSPLDIEIGDIAHGLARVARWNGQTLGEHGFSVAQHSLVVEEATPKLKRPPLYQVVLLNDDYTPMEFVVQVIQDVFHRDREAATRIMLHVHQKGVGVCGVYTYEVAETKVARVVELSRQHQHPLQCTMERE